MVYNADLETLLQSSTLEQFEETFAELSTKWSAAIVGYLTWPYSHFKHLGIPGPKPIPLIGNFNDIGKKAIYVVDEERINKYGNIVGTFEGWLPSMLVADIEMLKKIFIKDFEHFCDRRLLTMRGKLAHAVTDTNGFQSWRKQRSLLSNYFTPGQSKKSTDALNRCLDSFIYLLNQKYEDGECIEAKEWTNLFTFDAICCTAFGYEIDCVKNQDHMLFTKAVELFRKTNTTNIFVLIMLCAPNIGKILDMFNVEAFDMTYFIQFIKQIINDKAHTEETTDFIQTLTNLKESAAGTEEGSTKHGFTDDEIIGNSLLFLFAAYDTTTTTLAFLMYTLTVNEECQQKAYREIMDICGHKIPDYENVQSMEYMDMCLDETMRLYPFAGRLERVCNQDTVVNGIPIKKDTLIVLPVWYFHHNPEIWEDSDKFIPERFSPENKKHRDPVHYCPFGIGPRHCIGLRLAKLEIKLAAARILQNFKLVRNDRTQIPLQIDPSAFYLRSKDGIWLTLEKRQ